MKTRTGSFPIGFRRGNSEWQQDLDSLIGWAKEVDMEVIDLHRDGDTTAKKVLDAGLQVGSVDFPDTKGMISSDKGKRADAIARNAEYIRACAAYGPMDHFLVMLPEHPDRPRKENFGYMVDSFGELISVLEESDAQLVIEGWPGPGALCCTPAGYRAFFEACPSSVMGINYDPSHLVRQGIDPILFLEEFQDRVYHIHGKDTEIIPEHLYEYGHELPAIFEPRFRFGAWAWRYTIPGQGGIRWVAVMEILEDFGYDGSISIELEDANFNGTREGEQLGLIQGAVFLSGC